MIHRERPGACRRDGNRSDEKQAHAVRLLRTLGKGAAERLKAKEVEDDHD